MLNSQVPPRFRLQQSTFLGISSLLIDLRSKSFFVTLCAFSSVAHTISTSMPNPSTLFSGRPFEASEDAVFGRALQDDVVI